jgi:hypothetical protein
LSFKIGIRKSDPQIIHVFPCKNVEVVLVSGVCHSETVRYQNLTALHVVRHHILKDRHQSFWVHQVKVNQVLGRYLYVAFLDGDLPSANNRVVLSPSPLVGHPVEMLLDEQDFVAA